MTMQTDSQPQTATTHTSCDSSASELSRRDFLKLSAAVSAAGVFSQLGTNYAHAQGAERLRVGLVGCGGRGTGAVRDVIQADPATEIVAIGDVFKDRVDSARAGLKGLGNRSKVTEATSFVGFDAYQKVINSGVDIVLLCTPPGFRPQHMKAAVEAGKHIFAEKPVAVDATGVRTVIEASDRAKQKNLAIVAGTVYRHTPKYIETIKRIHEGAIGEVVGGQYYYNAGELWVHPRQPQWSDMEWQMRNWYYFTWLGGDLIVEQHVHSLDIMNWVMGAHPVSAYGMGGRQVRTDPAFGQIYDHFATEYEFPGGVRVLSMCRQMNNTDSRVSQRVVGTKGTAAPDSGSIKGANPARIEGKAIDYVQEHIDLIKSIRDGKPLNEGRQVAESTLTAIMGRESSYTGKLITWEQALEAKQNLVPEKLEFGPIPTPSVAMPGKTTFE